MSNRRRIGMVLIAAGSALSTGAAQAQFTWSTLTNGSWTDSLRWTPTGVPNSSTATATLPAGAYTVSLPSQVTFSGLTVGTGATMNLANGVSFYLNSNATFSNSGTISINDGTGINGTGFTIQGTNLTMSGTGALVLQAHPSNVDTARISWWGGTERLINNSGHTIRGTGHIATYLTNAGLVTADVAGLTLLVADRNDQNNGTMSATNGGTLALASRLDQDPAATVVAQAGSVVSITAGVFGGLIGSNGSGVVNFSGSPSTGSSPTFFGTVNIPDGSRLYVEGSDVTNNGTFTINPTAGPDGTGITVRGGDSTWSGTGTLRLNANSTNVDTASVTWWGGNERLTNSAGHSIKGSGRIQTYLTNNGLIRSDVPGQSLVFSNQAKTNNATIEAVGGANVTVSTGMSQGAAGLLRCDSSSSLTFSGATLNAGTVTTAAGGQTIFVGNSSLAGAPTLNGAWSVPDNNRLYIENTSFVNNGVMTLNPSSGTNGTGLTIRSGDCTVSGTGTLRLKASTANLDTATVTWWGGNERLINGAAQTLSGTGRILTYFTNDGTVLANDNGGTLLFSNQAKLNNNLMKATAGGTLYFNTSLAQSATARLVAETGSSVHFQGGSVDGGLVQSVGTGFVECAGNSYIGNVTNTADLRMLPGNTTYAAGGVTVVNNAIMKLGDTAAADGATFTLQNGNNLVTLTGTGSLLMAGAGNNPGNANIGWWNGNERLVNDTQHTIRGTGRFQVYLTNDGTITADTANASLWFTNQEKTNDNLMRARNGGTMLFQCPVTQTATGRIVAEAGSSITFNGGSVSGGELQTVGSGAVNAAGSVYIGTLTNRGALNLLPNNTVYMSGGTVVMNTGTITLGDSSQGNGAVLTLQNGNNLVELLGTGRLVLGGLDANPDTARVGWWNGNETLHSGPGHTIVGTGRIQTYFNNDGIISPGPLAGGIGTLNLTDRSSTLSSTSRLNIEIASASSFDRISGNSAITVGGTLHVDLLNGYIGGVGTTYEIVRGRSLAGTFSDIQIPAHPVQGLKYGVQYTGTSVLVRVTCDVDFNSDGVIDLFDYLDFVDIFSGGTQLADYNADGVVDFFDYLDFVQDFAAGCN